MKNNVNLEQSYGHFINGEFVKSESDGTIETVNPATGEVLSAIADGDETDVNKAVAAAKEAFASFRLTPRQERSDLLLKIADVIEENSERLAAIEALETGNTFKMAKGIVGMALESLKFFAAAIASDQGSITEKENGKMALILREPLGVVGAIVPWNAPFQLTIWKVAPALAAGNTVVLKPSEQSSLSALELVKLIKDIVPKGVINIVTGYGEAVGEPLQHHEDVKKLSFTGSAKVGRQIGVSAAERMIPSTLELGGKSANIIFEDADMEQAVQGATMGVLFNQGEVCVAGSRILVQETIYDEFVQKLKASFETVKVGDPFDEEVVYGSQVSEQQMNQTLSYIETAKNEGNNIVTGGGRLTDGDLKDGFFVEPTLIEANNQATCAREEIFGPVAVVMPFKDAKEAVEIANDTDYGLAGGVFTQNLDRGIEISKAIETGTMWVNTYSELLAGAPFGGYKQSGLGREGSLMTLDEFSQTKTIIINTESDLDKL